MTSTESSSTLTEISCQTNPEDPSLISPLFPAHHSTNRRRRQQTTIAFYFRCERVALTKFQKGTHNLIKTDRIEAHISRNPPSYHQMTTTNYATLSTIIRLGHWRHAGTPTMGTPTTSIHEPPPPLLEPCTAQDKQSNTGSTRGEGPVHAHVCM